MKTEKCTSCGAPIRWFNHAVSGKPSPLDPEPVEGGNCVIDERQGTYTVLPRGGEAFVEAGTPRFRSHFATCPNARHHRKS